MPCLKNHRCGSIAELCSQQAKKHETNPEMKKNNIRAAPKFINLLRCIQILTLNHKHTTLHLTP